MKKSLLSLMLSAVCCIALACSTPAAENVEAAPQTDDQTPATENPSGVSTRISSKLVNPHATAEAVKVYDVLRRLYGKKALSGTVAHVNWNIKEAENVHAWTGKWPVINVFDYIQIWASKDVNPKGWLDYRNVDDAVNWWKEGGIVGCMWHWNVKANNGSDMTCTPGTEPSQTSFSPARAIEEGTAENKQLLKDIDQVAGYMKLLAKENIPILWRPLHEAAGNSTEFEGGKAWFWWGADGPEVYVKLWRLLYDRLVNHHGLNNLIWIWNSQMGDGAWYPGNDYVDIVGRDNYYALQYPLMKEFRQLTQEYPTKLITLAECGNGDEVKMSKWSKIWAEGSRWSWFMTWYDYDYNEGRKDAADHQFANPEWWQDAWQSGVVVDREEMKGLLK
ncbi:MAG: beta-mannosidase [Bacteroidaceae bacterium]|nr:beta-mannosidase [Bacteroidaceae bacterium]MBR1801507.1 beta-mannosidase [Bacteroidaceae bacterium]